MPALHNPNSVAAEGAPVTLEKELAVGSQLAEMFGFPTDEDEVPCVWGHITSGGTVANCEALWNFRSVKFHNIALQAAGAEVGFDPGSVGPRAKPLSAYTKWELMNLRLGESIDLRQAVAKRFLEERGAEAFSELADAVRGERIEALGTAGFFLKHQDLKPPCVLVSASAHHSWEKGLKVLGFGTSNLLEVDVDRHMRLDAACLTERLRETIEARVPVLAVVGILGTTEFGTIDPIDEILAQRDDWRRKHVDFGVHVDAAWGGYLGARGIGRGGCPTGG